MPLSGSSDYPQWLFASYFNLELLLFSRCALSTKAPEKETTTHEGVPATHTTQLKHTILANPVIEKSF